FLGFVVLLLRTLILWGRGFDDRFDLWIFGTQQPFGMIYSLMKDIFAVLVLAGTAVVFYYRLLKRPERLSEGFEGLLILGIIATMMLADILYDAASLARGVPGAYMSHPAEPAGSAVAPLLAGMSDGSLVALRHVGFWTHSTLVLLFLNLLPI